MAPLLDGEVVAGDVVGQVGALSRAYHNRFGVARAKPVGGGVIVDVGLVLSFLGVLLLG